MENKFSIIILTYNEQDSLQSCLDSVNWCDDIVIIDSYSTDKTLEIAQKFNVRVFKNNFIDFAQQRNFANDTLDLKHDWVFHLDADERFTEELRKECNKVIDKYEYGAFIVPAKEILWGKWLKYSAGIVYQMRFHKLGDARFEQYGHGQRECDLNKGLGKLNQCYEHYFMSKGVNNWLVKHINYAKNESQNEINISLNKIPFLKIVTGKSYEKRRVLKAISYKIPLRPFFKFIYMFFLKFGFLDGIIGFRYCIMKIIYEQFIVLNNIELKNKKK